MTTENRIKLRFGVLLGIVTTATVARIGIPPLLGHPSNFSPIDAIALFSGCYFSRKWVAFLIPLVTVWFSDLFITHMYTGQWEILYSGFYWQYACYPVMVLIGAWLTSRLKVVNLAGASLTSSALFFVVTNFGSWVTLPIYPKTATGLALCYGAGIPFLTPTIISDLVYAAILFGAFEFAKKRFPVLAIQ